MSSLIGWLQPNVVVRWIMGFALAESHGGKAHSI
jgi:hypothetical protein